MQVVKVALIMTRVGCCQLNVAELGLTKVASYLLFSFAPLSAQFWQSVNFLLEDGPEKKVL